jgi:hypothetical protein
MADFVMTELQVGRTLCDIAKNYSDAERSNRAMGRAWKALETAEKYMRKLGMEHLLFDEMTALAERLRLELEALGQK